MLQALTTLSLLVAPAVAQDPSSQSVLFTNVMVLDGTSAAVRDVDVLVTDNLIARSLKSLWP